MIRRRTTALNLTKRKKNKTTTAINQKPKKTSRARNSFQTLRHGFNRFRSHFFGDVIFDDFDEE